MRTTEHQGKLILARHGIPVPRGSLVGRAGDSLLGFPLMAKTQILEGGRGRRGGVRLVQTRAELAATVAAFRAGTSDLPPADDVLVEEVLDIEREHYLAIILDRERRSPLLVAHSRGGIEIESRDDRTFLARPLDIRADVDAGLIAAVHAHLGLEASLQPALGRLLANLWAMFRAEDCLLAEINPLVVTTSGRLVAADARVVLDDAAAFRHAGMPSNPDGTPFERAVAATGAVGTELEGDVAVVTSGAGLGMCTVDLVAAAGRSPGCLIDLGGLVFQGSQPIGAALECVSLLHPTTLFVNVFLQAARCDHLARGLLAAWPRVGSARTVVRLRGEMAPEAARILEGCEAFVTEDLLDALDMVSRTTSGLIE